MRKTKIICTIGPAVNNEEKIKGLIEAGMNTARFNFSHGTHESHLATIEMVRRVAKECHVHIGFLLDSKGPEIRVKDFEGGRVTLEKGQTFILDNKVTEDGNIGRVATTCNILYKSVKPGDHILIDDGLIDLLVSEIKGESIYTKVLNGGDVSNHKSINVPGVHIPTPFLSEVDKKDYLFACENDMDFIACSFTRTKEDVKELREFLDKNGGERIQIIAKIENTQGVKSFSEIMEIADGAMVARGDLGVEIPFEKIPGIQKNMIRECRIRGKIVVVATQMLESMTKNPRPTRAEISDVANAVFDGTTSVMLSGESANGLYPIEAVKTMSKIVETAESSPIFISNFPVMRDDDPNSTLATAAMAASNDIDCKAIVVLSDKGRTVRRVSAEHPNVPIFGSIVDFKGLRQCALYYGVTTLSAPRVDSLVECVDNALKKIKERGYVKTGDKVVVVSGYTVNNHNTDILQITTIK